MKKGTKLQPAPAPQANTQPAITVGLDLSDRNLHFCEIDADGEIIAESRIPLTAAALRKQFGGREKLRIALETGAQSGWVQRELQAMGHEVIVANARAVESIHGNRHKGDQRDARQLARLARVDPALLAPVQLRARQQQLDLLRIRVRALLVEMRTMLVNGVRGLAKQEGERVPSTTTDRFAARARQSLTGALREILEPLLAVTQKVSDCIEKSEEDLDKIAETKYPDTRWLRQVPGVGNLTALTFLLTIGDPTRFAHSRDIGPYLGLTPARRQSGDSDPQLRITKCGDRYLRKLLVQCAHHILGRWGKDSALRDWGLKHTGGSRSSKKRAIVAVARKLAVLLHRLWTTKEAYKPYPNQVMAA